MDFLEHLGNLRALDDRIDNVHRAFGAFSDYRCDAVPESAETFDELPSPCAGDDSDHSNPDGEPFLHDDAEVVSSGETCGIGEIEPKVVCISDYVANCVEPDEDFHKTERRGKESSPLGYHYDP